MDVDKLLGDLKTHREKIEATSSVLRAIMEEHGRTTLGLPPTTVKKRGRKYMCEECLAVSGRTKRYWERQHPEQQALGKS